MGEELLILPFNIFAKVGVVRCVVADGFGCVFGLEGLKAKQVLHSEFELRLAILTATAIFVYSDGFLQRRHGIEDRIDDNLSACEVGA